MTAGDLTIAGLSAVREAQARKRAASTNKPPLQLDSLAKLAFL